MINGDKNKMMDGTVGKHKQEYHFAGDGIWKPKTIKAESITEAEKKWMQSRELVVLESKEK